MGRTHAVVDDRLGASLAAQPVFFVATPPSPEGLAGAPVGRAKGPDGIARYQAERNAESIDGLPGLAP